MAISTENRKRKLLALFLSLMMASSAVASLAACSDNTTDDTTDDDTTTEATETDDSRINNGSFEYLDRANGTKLILTSPTGWGSPSTGSDPTSKAASGIVDITAEAWENLTKSKLTENEVPTKKEDITTELWDKMSAFDKLTFYEAWEEADYDEDVDEQDFYDADTDSFNIDIDDVPDCENPGTHDGDEKNSNVLMIHNKNTNGAGTSQKYTSSSTVTLAAGTSAEFSLWIKTQDLTFNDGNNVIGERGAYIGVTQSVGGKSLDQFQIKNINTELLDEDETENGWVNYTFYLKGSSFASTTFNIVLGLGQSAVNTNHFEYVEGYAFFDDVTCKIITNEEYDETVKDDSGNYTIPYVDLSTKGENKELRFDKQYREDRAFAIDLYADFEEYEIANVETAYTEEVKKGVTYIAANDPSVTDKEVYYTLGEGFSIDGDVKELSSYTQLKAKAATNNYLLSALNASFGENGEDYPFAENDPVLMLLSAHGVNYTSKLKDATTFTLNKGESLAFSFFVKTSDMQGVSGANVKLVDGENATTLSTLDTTGVGSVDTDDQEDIFKGWQQCFFFVTNDTEKDGLTFHLEFSIGPNTVYGSTKDNYIEGYAAFAGFQVAKWTDGEYEYATSGSYAKTVSLVDATKEEYPTGTFDSPAYVPESAIEEGIANPKNYLGVKSGSGFVNGAIGDDKELNALYTNEYAGLISKKYVKDYLEAAANATAEDKYWLNEMGITTEAALNDLFGNSTQPLLIYNNDSAAQSYGFIASSTSTLAANNYATVSVRVKANGATAYVYLTDMDDDTRLSTLSVGRQVSYWYDKDGNVCASDPTDEFTAKTDVAFYRQANGLFLVNKNWSGSSGISATQYYANLANYEEKDGNLVVAEGGVTYDYNVKYDNEGLDGIAFYGKDGTYYAEPEFKTPVADFSTVTALKPRYTAADSQDLCVTVPDTNGEWVTVTFYLAAGDEAKSYRLEVWNGARNAETNAEKAPAGSYVMFDTNSTDSLTAENWTTWTNEAIDNIIEANGYEDVDDFKAKYSGVIYNTFSFFDSPEFLRYNGDIDENEVGNSYDDYDSTAKTEGISYLLYKKATKTEIYVSYLQDDVTVPVDEEVEEEEDTTTDDTPETDPTNLALLISSLIVAAVLVITLALVLIRKLVKWSKKNAAHRAATAKPKAKKEKPAKAPKKKEDHSGENDPYND